MYRFRTVSFFAAVIMFVAHFSVIAQDKPVGFGARVTGGGGSPVVVTSFGAFRSAVESGGKVVHVNGSINGNNGSVNVGSNTTIIGLKNSEIIRCNVRMSSVRNIIMKDVYIHDAKKGTCADDESGGDLVTVQNATRLWFDHCEFANPVPDWSRSSEEKNCRDGMLDIRGSAGEITISYTYFHDHWKGLLIGSSSSDNPSSRTVTMHHNYLRNMGSRLPSFRGGVLHYFNNYVQDVVGSGVNSREGACAKIESNVFESTKDPISSLYYTRIGYWDVRDNVFTECTFGNEFSQQDVEKSSRTCSIPYEYNVEPSKDVVASIFSGIVGPSWKPVEPPPVATRPVTPPLKTVVPVDCTARYTIRGERIAATAALQDHRATGIVVIRGTNGAVVTITKGH